MRYHNPSGRAPRHPTGVSRKPHLRIDFDRRLKLKSHGSQITSNGGLLACNLGNFMRTLALPKAGGTLVADHVTGKAG